MNITVVGTGYVGLVTGVCLAELGFTVTCVDINPAIVDKLDRGIPTIHEEGLEPLLRRGRREGRLTFSASLAEPVSRAEMIFLAVGTPTRPGSDEADLTYLEAAVTDLAPHLRPGTTVVVKSTVPVGTNDRILALIETLRPGLDVSLASNPEFLREGNAVADFFGADRIVCGIRDERSRARFVSLYGEIVGRGSRLVFTTPRNAELSKYASNAFLAMKITFINEIADLCEAAGADVDDVATLMGMDKRIGAAFLKAGPGYGGSCFPKDTLALLATARSHGVASRLVETTVAVNDARRAALAGRILAALGGANGRTVAVLGIAFKPDTDDVRDAPALTIVPALQRAGVAVRAHDPLGRPMGEKLLPGVEWFGHALDAIRGADAVVVLTDWAEYAQIHTGMLAAAMKGKHVFDFRNVLAAEAAAAANLNYTGIGRGDPGHKPLEVLTAAALMAPKGKDRRMSERRQRNQPMKIVAGE